VRARVAARKKAPTLAPIGRFVRIRMAGRATFGPPHLLAVREHQCLPQLSADIKVERKGGSRIRRGRIACRIC
jgi:hypothetical protein